MKKKKTIPAKTIHSKNIAAKRKIQKKRNRRWGAFFFLLIILSGAGYLFFRGWVQLQIPENNCAIIFSKVNKGGYDERIYYPGDYVWKWEAIIPGFVTVHNFPLNEQNVKIRYTASLPSADVYSAFSEITSQFEYSLTVNAGYIIDEEEILSRVLKGDLTSDNFEKYNKELYNSVEEALSEALWNNISLYDNNPENIFNGEWKKTLEEDIRSSSDKIKINTIYVTYHKIPDIELYNQAKNYYLTLMELKNRIRQEQVSNTVAAEEANERKLKQLKEYGEIITKYPLLIQFLALKSDPEYSSLVEDIFKN